MRTKKERKVIENVVVIDAGAKGKAIARSPDGRIIFISNAVPGDVVDVTTTKKRKAYIEGVATNFRSFSGKREQPVCRHFGVCGGCKWQHMKYEHQLFYKHKEVVNNLKRIGKLELPETLPILGSENTYFYRNKMEFSFSDNRWLSEDEVHSGMEIKDRNALGFHLPGMWDKILDITECHLQRDPSNAIRLEIKNFATQNGIPFFNPKKQNGMLRTLMIRTSTTGDIMVLLQFFREDTARRTLLLDHILETFPQITSLQYVVNPKQNDTIYDQEVICYNGSDHITEVMENLNFRINAKSFYQTNSEQAYELYKVVREYAGLTGNELVYDLYTGTGTIAQFLAKNARKVVGIESVDDAVLAARENADLNGITNVFFHTGDMKKVFNREFLVTNGLPDIIITDPPRDGMHRDVVQQILEIAPKKIVYVSCNSATQARDLELMKPLYSVSKIQPVDMFPQTHHVENVVLLEPVNPISSQIE